MFPRLRTSSLPPGSILIALKATRKQGMDRFFLFFLPFFLFSSTRHLVNFTKDEEGNEFPRDFRARCKWGVR